MCSAKLISYQSCWLFDWTKPVTIQVPSLGGQVYFDLNDNFLFKGQILSEVKETKNGESQEEKKSQGQKSILEQKMDRKRQEQKENISLTGSVATTMESRNSTKLRRSIMYIIGDYLYNKQSQRCRNDGSKVLHLQCSNYSYQCKARVHIDADTLKVLKFRWMHCCSRDPDLKFQIKMENEMKNLAETTKDSLKDIFNKVCLNNPVIGNRIEYKKIYNNMLNRRQIIMKADHL